MHDNWMSFVSFSYGLFAAMFFICAAISLKHKDFFLKIPTGKSEAINFNFVFYVAAGLLYLYLCLSPFTGRTVSTLIFGYVCCLAFVWFVIRLIKKERSKGDKKGDRGRSRETG